jgi:hypothetical protein
MSGWRAVIGLYRFGKLAPGGEVRRYFGFTAEHVAGVAGGLAASRS